jgi:hypothetical protein
MVEDSKLWANPARRDRCIAITADYMGRVSARLGIAKAQQHWDFNFKLPPKDRHDCPNKLRHTTINGRLAWDIYVERWQAAKADELKRMAGGTPKPAEVKPHPIGNEEGKDGETRYDENGILWVWVNREFPILHDVQTYEYADETSGKGPILPAGKPVTGYWLTTVDNEIWTTTRLGWRFKVEHGLKKAA